MGGFVYFYLYKKVKLFLFQQFGDKANPTAIYLSASIAADLITIMCYFPFDLIKCRLQSKNHVFRYASLPHAFFDELGRNGPIGLYKGSLPFFVTMMTFDAIQITMYESYMHHQRVYAEKINQTAHTLLASLMAGSIAAALTNPLECITVNVQTRRDFSILQYIR